MRRFIVFSICPYIHFSLDHAKRLHFQEFIIEMEAVEHKCVECDKVYSSGSNLYRHARQKHFMENKIFGSHRELKCPLCNQDFISRKTLEQHFEILHEIPILKEKMEFSSMDDFIAWKNNTEKENSTMYFKHSGSKDLLRAKTSYYQCHRSGLFKSKGNGKRSIKYLGSNKINGNCPAMMKVMEIKSKIVVEYTKTHIGHTNDIRRMKLEESERHAIAAKLANKLPITTILDDIRDSVGTHLDRVHFLTRRDLLNIKAQYKITSNGVLDSYDDDSIDNCITNMQNSEDLLPLSEKLQDVCSQLSDDNCNIFQHLPSVDKCDTSEDLFADHSDESSDVSDKEEEQVTTLKCKSNAKIALKRKMYCEFARKIEECDSVTDLLKLQEVIKNAISSYENGKLLETKTSSDGPLNKKIKEGFVSSKKECVQENNLLNSRSEESQEVTCTLILNAESNYEQTTSNVYIIANNETVGVDDGINIYYSV